jgi:hypothetical protein
MRFFAVAVAVAMLALPTAAVAGPSIAGNFQGWNPADPNYELTVNANGVYVFTMATVDTIPLHEYKAVDGDAWGADFPGNNQSFDYTDGDTVTFYVNLGDTVGVKNGDEFVFHSFNPPIVCGDFMSELGGSDWDQTDESTTVMTDPDGDDVWAFESVIPAGSYNFKIVLNNNWDQNTSSAGDIPFASDGVNSVLFTYDMSNNTTTVYTDAPPTVISARLMDHQDFETIQDTTQTFFSKDVEETTAETVGNYTILVDGGPSTKTIVSAKRDDADNKIVYLGLAAGQRLDEGHDYKVVVTGVTDTDGRPVDPNNNDACFYVHEVLFKLNMHKYVDDNGVPTTVHIQGDQYPLTWDACGGRQAYDDGTTFSDETAADTTYTTTHRFSLQHDCEEDPVDDLVKYKYLVDCTTWEGVYDFGHYVTVTDSFPSQTMDVWWEDKAPQDYISCDVGVLFQVTRLPDTFNDETDTLTVRGTVAPLNWGPGTEMNDDGLNGDKVADDDIYSVEVVFPTDAYRYLEYKYAINGAYECDTYPNRTLTLDDENGCMPARVGPMEILDLWNWCDPVAVIEEGPTTERKTWGVIKSLYR